MGHVQTVLGPVPPDRLGRVMPHEHLQSLVPGDWLTGGTRPSAVDAAVGALSGLADLGFGTVVDLSPYGVVGRSPDGTGLDVLREISRRTGLHVVAGSAVYLEAYSPAWTLEASLADLTARFVADATVGVAGTGIKVGVYGEQATGLGEITPHEEKCLRAVARAHRETGLAICTHTTHGTMAREQLDILTEEGADLSRVVVGHMDIQDDPRVIRAVLDRGACVAFDTIGKQFWDFFLAPPPADPPRGEFPKRAYHRPDAARVELLVDLVGRGYADQLLLAQDLTGAEVYLNPATHGRSSYSYLGATFVPLLLAAGIGPDAVEQMVRANPARLLTVPA